ncbi:hypothetical protein BDF19DRAFT_435787 [Syncephalis fuscata]|nr:hypothetical protein BDF19DRAFT_435787 [Syncephalis fuscata]
MRKFKSIINCIVDIKSPVSYPKTLRAFIIAEIEKEQLQGRWDALQVELGRLDTAWSENNTNLRHVLEQSCERKEKLQTKVAGHTSDTNLKLGDYLGQITQQRIYQPIVACANAWSLRQKQHRIERLDIIIDLLLEQHILHQLLTTTFDLEQKYCMKCQKTILHLCTRLEQWSTVHQQRMNKMKHPFYSTGISLEDKHNEKDNESMLSVDQLLNQIISSIGVEGKEGETLDEDIITKSIYSPRNTTCSMALSLMHELKETNRQLSQVSTERNGQLHDLRQAKNTIHEILQRFSSTHDTLNYPKDELDQAVILRQKINKLRPCLAEIAKNQQASSLLTAKRDMFCEFLLNSDQFIGNRS